MDTISIILGSIIGIPTGVGAALFIMASLLNKSNNIGDSKAEVNDFSESGIIWINKQDRVSSKTQIQKIDV